MLLTSDNFTPEIREGKLMAWSEEYLERQVFKSSFA